MSLRDRIIDAELLWRNGRTEGALLSVLLAVEVTARKRYPIGTKSKTRVNKKTGQRQKMGDGEAFRTFLKEELRRYGAIPLRLLMNKPPSDPPKLPRYRKMPPIPECDGADIEVWVEAHRKWEAKFQNGSPTAKSGTLTSEVRAMCGARWLTSTLWILSRYSGSSVDAVSVMRAVYHRK